MPMGVYTPHVLLDGTFVVMVYTQRGFLHCLFGTIGFLRTSISG